MNYSLERLAVEQDTLMLTYFNYDFAWLLGQNIRERASRMKAPVAIEVSHGSTQVFVALLPGATSDNLAWTARKRAVALRFHRSSLAVRFEAEKENYDFNERFRLPREAFVASGGGVPLILRNGTIIGAAAVSGLPDIDDHMLVVDSLREMLNVETGNRWETEHDLAQSREPPFRADGGRTNPTSFRSRLLDDRAHRAARNSFGESHRRPEL